MLDAKVGSAHGARGEHVAQSCGHVSSDIVQPPAGSTHGDSHLLGDARGRDDRRHHFPRVPRPVSADVAVLVEVQALPRPEVEGSMGHRHGHGRAHEGGLDVPRHVVIALHCVLEEIPVPRFGADVVECGLHICAHGGVGVLVDREARGGVADEEVCHPLLARVDAVERPLESGGDEVAPPGLGIHSGLAGQGHVNPLQGDEKVPGAARAASPLAQVQPLPRPQREAPVVDGDVEGNPHKGGLGSRPLLSPPSLDNAVQGVVQVGPDRWVRILVYSESPIWSLKEEVRNPRLHRPDLRHVFQDALGDKVYPALVWLERHLLLRPLRHRG
mmetsp:Transcript_47693/g.152882  ORF Transcript_47693/g.152882 Transcript_47693/m.152882 type:complete len:329 (+) Transcript_47693:354-1340(+)